MYLIDTHKDMCNCMLTQEEQNPNQWDVEFDRALLLWDQDQKDSTFTILLVMEEKSKKFLCILCAYLKASKNSIVN